MADNYDKLGVLGERCVQRILCRTHYEFQLRPEGCRSYKVYSTRQDKETQQGEVDLIEEWISADGEKHTKAHEVKCERITFVGDGYGVKRNLEEAIGWALCREKVEGTATANGIKMEKKPGFRIRGTGNAFIEMQQDVPEGQEVQAKNKGWAVVLAETEDAVMEKYTDGRDLWLVQYTPRDVPEFDFQVPETGIRYQGEYEWAEPYNYFTALQMPSSVIANMIRFDKLDKYCVRTARKTRMDWKTGKEYTVVSQGHTIPIVDLYNMDLLEDERFGRKDERTQTVFHQAKEVWACEPKDINEDWTAEDYVIDAIEINL